MHNITKHEQKQATKSVEKKSYEEIVMHLTD